MRTAAITRTTRETDITPHADPRRQRQNVAFDRHWLL